MPSNPSAEDISDKAAFMLTAHVRSQQYANGTGEPPSRAEMNAVLWLMEKHVREIVVLRAAERAAAEAMRERFRSIAIQTYEDFKKGNRDNPEYRGAALDALSVMLEKIRAIPLPGDEPESEEANA